MDMKAMFQLSYGLFVVTAKEGEKDNGCITNTAGQVTTTPNRITLAVNKNNYTHDMILRTGVFNVSILSEKAVFDTFRHFGFQSGRDVDKFAALGLHAEPGTVHPDCPILAESPLALECRVTQTIPLGSHELFLAVVEGVCVDESLLDSEGKLRLDRAGLIAYNHGEYRALGKRLGTFGYSVRKKRPAHPKKR